MIILIENLLTAEQLADIHAKLGALPWEDGKLTAGGMARAAKNNQQITNPAALNDISGILVKALFSRPEIQPCFPKLVLEPIINKYEVGEYYGKHLDNPIRKTAQGNNARCDFSCTIALNDGYGGGELLIHDGQPKSVKLKAGNAVIYPSNTIHEVLPVTSGTRISAVTWLQSAIKDADKREVMQELQCVASDVSGDGQTRLAKVYLDLTRMWFDV